MLTYSDHAQKRMLERGVTPTNCEEVVKDCLNPWQLVMKSKDLTTFRFDHNQVVVITDHTKTHVITVFKGSGYWNPETDV